MQALHLVLSPIVYFYETKNLDFSRLIQIWDISTVKYTGPTCVGLSYLMRKRFLQVNVIN